MMKKLCIIAGIVCFFTCTALAISFNGWTWIEERALMDSLDYCIQKNGSLITKETRTRNGIIEYYSICVCNPGYEYNFFTNYCEPESLSGN